MDPFTIDDVSETADNEVGSTYYWFGVQLPDEGWVGRVRVDFSDMDFDREVVRLRIADTLNERVAQRSQEDVANGLRAGLRCRR